MLPTSRYKIFTLLNRCDLRERIVVVASIGVSYQLIVNKPFLQRSLLLEFDLRQFAFRRRAVVYRVPIYFKRLVRSRSCRT